MTTRQGMSSRDTNPCKSGASCRIVSFMAETVRAHEVADITDVIIGENVATLRRRANLTVKQVGDLIAVGESAASYKIKGTNPWKAKEVRILADRFHVSVGVLYGDDPMPLPTAPARVTRLDPSKNSGKNMNRYIAAASVIDFRTRKAVA